MLETSPGISVFSSTCGLGRVIVDFVHIWYTTTYSILYIVFDMDAIETRNLTKTYKAQIGRRSTPSLVELNLTVRENEVFGFLGRNGAGKTTTIKLLCGLIRPTRGEARIFGEDSKRKESRRQIGYLPENPYFYEYLTPRETLDFYGKLHGLNAAARAAEWKKLSELLDLGSIADQRVRGFSKGMRQRLGFAVALVGDPQLLVLDEPMSGLDPLGRRSIRELILRMRDEKKTIFFSSHVLGDVEQICDRVGILVKGRLTRHGQIDELLTEKVMMVEIIAARLNDAALAAIAPMAASSRTSEAGHHFVITDLATANRAVKEIHNHGGDLVDFAAVKESLEDYFMRVQEAKP
ncbi:MAG: ABC transporter ATP-binding protein [Candidatus Hydrogenedentes bacterium]|nr:ABC transporter ATP-binding protein [Candidatus Hydrogenedentota bacterium]